EVGERVRRPGTIDQYTNVCVRARERVLDGQELTPVDQQCQRQGDARGRTDVPTGIPDEWPQSPFDRLGELACAGVAACGTAQGDLATEQIASSRGQRGRGDGLGVFRER